MSMSVRFTRLSDGITPRRLPHWQYVGHLQENGCRHKGVLSNNCLRLLFAPTGKSYKEIDDGGPKKKRKKKRKSSIRLAVDFNARNS